MQIFFSLSVTYLLISKRVVHKSLFFILMKYNLLIFILWIMLLVLMSKNSSPSPRAWRFSPMCSSESFIVLVNVRCILSYFLYKIWDISRSSFFSFLFFFCWHMDIQLLQYHLLKRLSFLHRIAFAFFSKISWLYLCESISRFSILFHWSSILCHWFLFFSISMSISPPIPHGLDYL